MEYKKYTINDNDVYFIKSNKFKTITIDTLFIGEYDNSFTKYKFLSNILCRSNKTYPDELLLSKKIVDLYDFSFSTFNNYLNYHTLTFRINFLNEKYTEKGMNEKSIDFYYDMIYNPNITNDEFEKTNFDLTKNRLNYIYESREQNSSYHAFKGACESLSYDVPLKYNKQGNKEELEKITPKNLYKLYLDIINNRSVKVFVIGDFDDNEMKKILSKNLKKGIKKDYIIEKYELKQKTKKEIIKEEEKNYNQSILILFYKIVNMTERQRNVVLPLFNEILGGSSSKLFNNVREKSSLAYYIYSSYYSFQNTLEIESGISKENHYKVKKKIKEEINNMIKGNISEEEIEFAKNKIITSLKRENDVESSILNSVIDEVVFKTATSDKLIKDIKTVTKEELMHLGTQLSLDVDYILKGVKE